MLKDNAQMTLDLSPYQGLYEVIIPQNHILKKLKENIDFSFVNPMLRKQYCEHFGRPAKEPEMMFKLLFLKKLYDLSDEQLISRAQTDMAYKYFLGLSPEDKIIDPSLLRKFRKTRITEDILEDMLKETIQQAIQKGLVKSGRIIVDATHTEVAQNYRCSKRLSQNGLLEISIWGHTENHSIHACYFSIVCIQRCNNKR